jgi:hypothetical protein
MAKNLIQKSLNRIKITEKNSIHFKMSKTKKNEENNNLSSTQRESKLQTSEQQIYQDYLQRKTKLFGYKKYFAVLKDGFIMFYDSR